MTRSGDYAQLLKALCITEALVYRFINKFTIRMIDGILVRNQNGHHFKTSQTGLER